MIRLKLWIGLILVFILGAFVGSLGMGLYYKNRIERFARYGHPARSQLLLKKLSKELNLTQQQKREIETIVEQFYTKLSDIKQGVRPEINSLRDHTFLAIREKLNEDQRKKFDELHKRWESYTPRERLRAMLTEESLEQIISDMKTRLKLTEEQGAKAGPIIRESFEEQRKIVDKYRNRDRSDLRALRNALRKHQISVEERLSKILTAGQLVEFRKLQEERRRKIPSRESGGTQ